MINWLKRIWNRLRRKAPAVDVWQQACALNRQQRRELVIAAGWRRVRAEDRKTELWENGSGHVCSLFLAAVDALKDEVTTR